MAPKPSSSSSPFARNDDENNSDPSLQPKMVLNNCILQLCDMAKIEIEEGDDLTCQSFVEGVVEHVGEFFGRYYRLIDDHAQRPPFQRRAHVAQFEPGSSSASQIAQSERSIVSVPVPPPYSPEVISLSSTPQYGDSPYPPVSPFCVISTTYHVQTPERTETNILQNNLHHGPTLYPPLPRDGSQSTLASLEEIGQPQSTNTISEVGTSGVGALDNLFHELLELVYPSSSHQSRPRRAKRRYSTKKKVPTQQDRKKPKKKAKQPKSNRERHEPKDFENGHYHCTCGSKFKLKKSQKRHLKRYNSEWKFPCDHCTDTFHDLWTLKSHLSKQHGIEKPLIEYVTGCTLCGIKFRTTTAFYNHQKTKHNINQGPRYPRRSPWRAPLTPRRPPWMTPRQREPDSSPQNPMVMSPRDEEIDVEQQVTPKDSDTDLSLDSDNEEDAIIILE